MSEYKVSKKKARKFLSHNLGPLLRRCGSPILELAGSINTDQSQIHLWTSGERPPQDPNTLIRLYAAASATEADYRRLRKIIYVQKRELAQLRKNTRPVSDNKVASLAAVNGRAPKLKRWSASSGSLNSKLVHIARR